MKTQTYNSLGFDIPINVYESYTEGDKAAGKENAILDEANANLVYRGALPDARDVICTAIERLTNVRREYKPVMRKVKQADGTEKEVPVKRKDESGVEYDAMDPVLDDADYVKAALATSQIRPEDIKDQVAEAVRQAGVSVDIRAKARKPTAPKTLAKQYKDGAEKAIKEGKVESFAKQYQKVMGRPLDVLVDGQPNVEKLGWAIKEFIDERNKKTLSFDA